MEEFGRLARYSAILFRLPRFCFALILVAIVLVPAAPSPTEAASKPVIYLTFDDGPGVDTNLFLDLLEGHTIHATFFVNGRHVVSDPATTHRIVTDGHAIANHTWNHANLTRSSNATVVAEFIETNKVVYATTGVQMTCYRPPFGATSGRIHDIAVSVGIPNDRWMIDGRPNGRWDIDTNDWRLSVSGSGWSPAKMMEQLNQANDGDTILLHDGPSNRLGSYEVLAEWLAVNRARFDFQPLPGCGGVAMEPSIDPDAPSAWPRFQIGRLYKAYFDRVADPDGLEYWTRIYASGITLEEISAYFATSSEFQSSGELNDQQFVEFVYRAVLDRRPDPEGSSYWATQLSSGAADRGSLLVYFSESAEHLYRTASELTGGCYSGDVATSYLCLSSNVVPYT